MFVNPHYFLAPPPKKKSVKVVKKLLQGRKQPKSKFVFNILALLVLLTVHIYVVYFVCGSVFASSSLILEVFRSLGIVKKLASFFIPLKTPEVGG
jgi:hypothetical protein